jgi:pimeloyl-ACP methyl ester carboxylesterase
MAAKGPVQDSREYQRMQRRKFGAMVFAAAVALMPVGPVSGAPAALGLHVKPCTQGKAKLPALCGTFGVYENRATQSGRVIAIKFIVVKAAHPTNKAIAIIAGGPGESATPYAAYVADGDFRQVTPLLNSYNIVLMDDRGMGGSNGLPCSLTPASEPASYFRDLFPSKLVTACRTKYAATSDLALFNTNYATDDLNDIRAALGYPKLVLDGGSYGTFFSLIYMRRHPQSVESAVLNGVDPPGFQPLPGEPMGVQRALDDLIAKCKRDATCNAHFPTFGAQFYALVARLNKGPIPVTLVLKKGAAPVTVQLSKDVFVDRLRQTLYDPAVASAIPYVIDRASRGDTAPLATLINVVAVGLDEDITTGAWLSYTCAEGIPFLDPSAVSYAAAHSFASDLRIEQQRQACAIWNVPAMPASFNDPVRSDAQVLIISGSDDPATPPRYAASAVRYLPNAKIVLVQGAGHGTETKCVDKLFLQFVRAQSTKGLNVNGCSSAFTVPKFIIDAKDFENLTG